MFGSGTCVVTTMCTILLIIHDLVGQRSRTYGSIICKNITDFSRSDHFLSASLCNNLSNVNAESYGESYLYLLNVIQS